jgi:hypothetical protein
MSTSHSTKLKYERSLKQHTLHYTEGYRYTYVHICQQLLQAHTGFLMGRWAQRDLETQLDT